MANIIDTPFGTIQVTVVREARIYLDAWSPGLSLRYKGKDYRVSLSVLYNNGVWEQEIFYRSPTEPLTALESVIIAKVGDPDGVYLPLDDPARVWVVEELLPQGIAWASNPANMLKLLEAEEAWLETYEVAPRANHRTRLLADVAQVTAELDIQNQKLADVRARKNAL